MRYTNHHAHSTFSDGKRPPEDFLRRAVELGMAAYGFSDHAPVPIHDFGNMEMGSVAAYVSEIDRLRREYGEHLEIWRSMEVDYIPGILGVSSPSIVEANLDYTIGAVHYVEELDGKPWSFQKAEPVFSRGIDEIFGGNARAMVERYFELIREMVERDPPDVVAHLDRVKKRNLNGKFWDEHSPWFRRQIKETLAAIKRAGCILEVNTRGIYKGEITDTYPSGWIVAEALKSDIPIQINSDAHEVPNITGAFDTVYPALRRLGVEKVRIFRRGTWVDVPIQDFSAVQTSS